MRDWRPEDHAPPEEQPAEGQAEPTAAGAEAPDEEEPSAETNAIAAAALFRMSCAPCHGNEGHGDGPSRPPTRVQDLSDPTWQSSHTNEQIAQVIFQGRGMMPGFGSQVQPEGIAALVMHVRTLAAH